MQRRTLGLALPLLASLLSQSLAAATRIEVYKTPTCGCCGKWVEHLRANGFEPLVKEVSSTTEYQARYGVPDKMKSCHTAVVNGYTIEGHVPAADIERLLKERPKAKGLAAPGMPAGSPGMDSAHHPAYAVMLFDANGKTSVYHEYPAE